MAEDRKNGAASMDAGVAGNGEMSAEALDAVAGGCGCIDEGCDCVEKGCDCVD